ncbi:aldehyde dehydrogenase family protein, partial [Streptomyces massasporeus]|uniref:aldehyde dehydrogenase family protein n=1 Tax=Streptomyces massasporeus TaxID=67324 RepID=UPI0034514484
MTVVRDVPKQLFIGGGWRDAESGRTLAVDNPATGEELCRVADASPADGQRAVDAAVAAQPAWAATPPRIRSEILRRAHDLIIARTEDLALLMTLEMGKPLAEARAEVAYGAEFFRWFSEEAVRIDGGLMTAP